MADDGSGNFSLPSAAFVAGTTATAATVNANFSDIATALTARVTRNGSGSMSGNLAMGTNRVTGMGSGTARTDAASVAQVQDSAPLWGGTAGGTADALTLTITPAIAAYAAGQVFRFISASANTGAATMAVSGLSAKNIRKGTGSTALDADDIPSSAMIEIAYDGTQFILLNVSRTEVQARAAIAAAPLPATASGVGQFASLTASSGDPLVLPADGSWVYFALSTIAATGAVTGSSSSRANGGSTIAAGSAGVSWNGFCWRVG